MIVFVNACESCETYQLSERSLKCSNPRLYTRPPYFTPFNIKQESVDFEGFTSALYEVAMYSLSKEMYRDLYPNDSDKVQVLLNLWGVASPEKLAQMNEERRLEEEEQNQP